MSADHDEGTPRAAVIIPNWNGSVHVDGCLHALRAQTFKRFEAIVVDNGSTDGSREMITRNHPWVRLLPFPDNRGFSAAANLGITSSTAEYVVLLNNDTRPEPRWLEALVRALDEVPSASFGASKLLLAHEDSIDAAGDRYSIWRVAGRPIGAGEPATSRSVRMWVFGACAAAAIYRRSFFEELGMFDEDFFLLHEDIDMDMRAQVAGHACLYIPDAIVRHVRGASTDSASHEIRARDWRNRLWVVGKNLPWPIVVLEFVILLSRASVGALLRGGGRTYAAYLFDGMLRLRSKRRASPPSRISTLRALRLLTSRPLRASDTL
jgi:GT2 family glycosyltransferase